MYLGLFFFSIHQQYMFFWISIGHKSYRDNQIGPWNRCCLWPFKHAKKLVVTNWEPPELYTHFKPVYRTTFETTWRKLQNLLWMELVTDVTLIFLGNKLYLGLIWACYRKCQCKEKYISCFGHQNLGILVWKFHWIIHCLDNNRPIAWETIDLLFSKTLMGLKENSCCSIPSLGNPETYVSQCWCYKIFLIHHDLISWGTLQNLLWLELITDATFLMQLMFLSSVNDDFFYYRNGLWNLLNWRIFGILVLESPVRFNWISKQL